MNNWRWIGTGDEAIGDVIPLQLQRVQLTKFILVNYSVFFTKVHHAHFMGVLTFFFFPEIRNISEARVFPKMLFSRHPKPYCLAKPHTRQCEPPPSRILLGLRTIH